MSGRLVGAWDSYRRIGPFDGRTLHAVGMVVEGATTPWRWASLPGLPTLATRTVVALMDPGDWRGRICRVTSERLPEPLSPEARALVQAARGAR